MSLSYSFKFAGSLIFPKSEKKSIARKSLFGAVLCIGLSLVPLVVVTSVTNGMIDGMTERIIGLSTSHIQAYVAPNISRVKTAGAFIEYARDAGGGRGVKGIYPERFLPLQPAKKAAAELKSGLSKETFLYATNPLKSSLK